MGTSPSTVTDTPHSDVHERLSAEAGWVHRLAHSLVRDKHVAADVAQDALAAAVEKPPRLGRRRLQGWLRGAVRHLAWRRRREELARARREARVARPSAGNSHEAAVERLRLHQSLTEAVLALREPYRIAVIGLYFDGRSSAEIAREENVRPELVRQRLHRGLGMLRARLDEEFGDRRAWALPLAGLLRTATVGTVFLGVTTVKKLATAAVAAVILLALAYRMLEPDAPAPGGFTEGQALVAKAPVDRSPVDGTDAAPERSMLASPVEGELLTVEVVGARGSSIPEARVWAWSSGADVFRGTTDGAGRVVFPGAAEPGRLLVVAIDRLPAASDVERFVGLQRVVLEAGDSLQGWVRVDGETPRESITLQVIGNAAPLSGDLPPELLAELEGLQLWDYQEIRTEPDGSFRLGGLPPTWSGQIALPNMGKHWFNKANELDLDNERTVLLPTPRSGLQLELTELPFVSGRVIWSDTREGVERASVRVNVDAEDGVQIVSFMSRTQPNGRFCFGLRPGSASDHSRWVDPARRPALKSIRIGVGAPDAVARHELELDPALLDPPGEVGTIVLDRRPIVHFVVRDQEGKPVPGAYVYAHGISEPADREGRGTVHRAAGPYTVGATGYLIEKQEPRAGFGTLDNPFEFVLEPGNVLTLQLRDPEGGVPPVGWLQVLVREPLFTGSDGWPTSVHSALFLMPHGSRTDEGTEMNFRMGPDGRLVLPSLTPRVKLTVYFHGALGDLAVRKEIVGPGPGEGKEVEVLVPRRAAAVSGRVLDEQGRPVPNAEVTVHATRTSDGVGPSRTRGDGTFTFEPVFADQPGCRVEVRHPGHAVAVLEEVTLGPSTGLLEFRLERGHDLRVRVVDPTGGPVPVSHVGIEGIPRPRIYTQETTPTEEQPGVFTYRDLPARPVRLYCTIAGQRYEVGHHIGGGNDEAVITVPEMGWLVLETAHQVSELTVLTAHIESPARPDLRIEEHLYLPPLRRSHEIPLPPGDYRVTLRDEHQGLVSGPVRVTVRARELAELRM